MSTPEPAPVACYEENADGELELIHRPMTEEELADYNERLAAEAERQKEAATKPAPLSDDELVKLRGLIE